MRTRTRTKATLFNTDQVDRLCGALHTELESDYEKRREHVSQTAQRAIESRLAMVRAVWMLLLDEASE